MKRSRLLASATLILGLVTDACGTDPASTMKDPQPPAPTLAPLPEAVTSFGAVTLDGWLYVYGGHKGERHEYCAEMVSGAFHRLRVSDGTRWEPLPSGEPAQGAPLVAHRTLLYRVGGMAAQNPQGEKQDLRSKATVARFDPEKRAWQEFTALPEPRSSHDAVVAGDTLYVAGGWQLKGGTSKATWHSTLLTLDLKDPAASWKSVPQPFQRRAVAMAAVNDRIYVLGGMDANDGTSLAVDILDTRTGAWSRGPDLPNGPMKGFGCSAIVQNGRLYFSGMKGELYQLSAAGTEWELVGKLQQPRFFHRLVPAGSRHLIAAGGEDSSGKLTSIEVLTPAPERTSVVQ